MKKFKYPQYDGTDIYKAAFEFVRDLDRTDATESMHHAGSVLIDRDRAGALREYVRKTIKINLTLAAQLRPEETDRILDRILGAAAAAGVPESIAEKSEARENKI